MADRIVNQARLQEIKPGEYATEVYTVTAATAAVAQQRFFLAGTGRQTLSVAGNIRALLRNPVGSRRVLQVARISATVTALSWADLWLNPTTGLPAGVRLPWSAVLGAPAGVGDVLADTDIVTAIGGGTALSSTLGLPAGRHTLDLPPLVVPPGMSLGINIAATAAVDATFNLYWIEDDA